DGVPMHLPAKEFETLLLLVENNGKALSKDQMMSSVWQDAFVEEGNLAKQVSKLRKLLKGDRDGGANIETIPKHGYRFSADVRLVESESASPIILQRRTVKRITIAPGSENDHVPMPRALPPAPRAIARRIILPLTVLVLLSGVVLFWYWNRSAPSRVSQIKSIAVLPLRSLTPDEEIDALGLGLTDSLITELGSVRHIVVRPIASVRGFSNSTEDALEIGRKLRVDAVLDGTIQEAGGRLRINARLVSTANGEQIWAEKFDDNFTNMFEVQDRISEQAARTLTAMLTGQPSNQGRLTKRYTENPAAFDAYLKGRYHWNKRNDADFRRAIEYFNRAVELDPNYALAYAGLADSHILLAVWGTEPPASSMELAKQAALKALSADPNIAEAHTSLAFVKWVYDWDFPGADAEFLRAIELNPNYATAHHWRSYYLVSMDRGDEAILAIKRAQELEGPLSLGIMTDVGEIYCWAKHYEDAIEHLNEVIRVEPNYAVAHYELGIAYLKTNKITEAVAELSRARELESEPRIVSALAFAFGAGGRPDEARAFIGELEAESARRYVSPFSIAIAYAGLGEDETAIDWLRKARAERSDAMAILKVHPLLSRLHANPRFMKLAQEVGY
ncbi:MAG TPA: tetratricopeptide repeat protein, partial [Pyrinomonadaceae bacterium]|nr:tetratricopeptide repeat protein [Pyrinomonadaceae bacterium]